jgi:nucleotide-binding universal stress UspA family protein
MKILIGYDGSEYSGLAIEDLRKAGLPTEAQAFVLTVGEAWDLPVSLDRLSASSEKFVHPTTRAVEKHLQEAAERSRKLAEGAARRIKEIFPVWSVESDGVCGKPAVELITKADEWSPDLLVVGSHGRSALGRAILGSVSQKVLNESRCSVRIAKKNEAAGNSNLRILIAVDGSPNAEEAVKTVAGRNWPKDTEVRLIAVDDPFSPPEAGYISWSLEEEKPVDNEETRRWIGKVIEAPGEILRAAGLRVSHDIRWGDAASMILREANDWQPDSLFIGARGPGAVKRFLLGSVSSTVAVRAHCSVEIVRLPPSA